MVLWRPLTARPLRLAGLRAAYTFAAFGKKEYWGGGFERGQESTNNITSLLITAASLATGILWSHSAAADGALAVGLPSDVAKGGFRQRLFIQCKNNGRRAGDSDGLLP